MEKVLERFEGLARIIVPICYMLGLIVGTMYYFTDGGGNLGGYFKDIGGCLAVATELHSFLLQRRVLVAWTKFKRAHDGTSEEEAKRDLWMYGGWLVALLAFQIFTAIMYRAAVWHPSTALLPAIVQIIIAGAVLPIFFFGVAFLANVVIDPKDVQDETQRTTAMQAAKAGQWIALRALKAANRSFQYRLKQAEKDHADLTGLAVGMQRRVGDDEGAHSLMVIDNQLRDVEGLEPRQYAGVWRNPDANKSPRKSLLPPTPPHMTADEQEAEIARLEAHLADLERSMGGKPGGNGQAPSTEASTFL